MPSAHSHARKCGPGDKERGQGAIHTDMIIIAAMILDEIVKKKKCRERRRACKTLGK